MLASFIPANMLNHNRTDLGIPYDSIRWENALAAHLADIGVGLKEWVGLVAYYALDRIDELFPAPTE
jgi:hypothetical protein